MGSSIAEDVVIRPADKSERRQGARIFAEAMGRKDEAVEDRLYKFSNLLAEGQLASFLVAEHKGDVVGYGGLVTYASVGWIAFMGTVPELQGRGVGAIMMEGLMDLARKRGIRTLKLDATNIGLRLYSGFRFEKEYAARNFEIPAQCGPGSQRGKEVKLATGIPEWCLAMDRRAFGDDRSQLLEMALKDGGKVLLVEEQGFGIVHGRKLGPLIANTTDAALDILFRAGTLGSTTIYVPLHPSMPEGFLGCLKPSEPESSITCCTRMHWGEPIDDDFSKVFAAYSAATG